MSSASQELSPASLGRVLLVSPHLDDAVFGCGDFLLSHPGTFVVTVFAGIPDASEPATDWDAQCGFSNPIEAMQARRDEDRAALNMLGAAPIWLDLLDDQYRQPLADAQRETAIVQALTAVIHQVRPDTIVLPLGLFHSDHERVHRAALACLADAGCHHWLAYEEALYRRMDGLLQRRLGMLGASGWLATPLPVQRADCSEQKNLSIECYTSQLHAFGKDGYADCWQPERFWRLTFEPVSHAA